MQDEIQTSLDEIFAFGFRWNQIRPDYPDEIGFLHMCIPFAVYCVIRRVSPTNSKFHPTGVGFIPSARTDLIEKDCNFVSKLQSFFGADDRTCKEQSDGIVSCANVTLFQLSVHLYPKWPTNRRKQNKASVVDSMKSCFAGWNPSELGWNLQPMASDEIKSVLIIPTKSDFITKWFHPTGVGFIPSARTDLVEKSTHCLGRQMCAFFWCGWQDLQGTEWRNSELCERHVISTFCAPVPQVADQQEKTKQGKRCLLAFGCLRPQGMATFWCGWQDLNLHGFPHEPESCASANFATSANIVASLLMPLYYTAFCKLRQVFAQYSAKTFANSGGFWRIDEIGRKKQFLTTYHLSPITSHLFPYPVVQKSV